MKPPWLILFLLLSTVPAFAQTVWEGQSKALAEPTPASLYNAGVAWEQAQAPVQALYFYRQATALGLPEAANAQTRVEANLGLPTGQTWVLPAFRLWLAAITLAGLAFCLGVLHLLRPRPPVQRLAWGLAGLSGLAGGLLLVQGWLLAPGPMVLQAQELRTGPGLAFPVTRQIPAGAEVKLLQTHSGWAKLNYQDQSGWLPQGALLP